MGKIIVQIYEVQDSPEAERLIEAGVDHIGSVIASESRWNLPDVKEVFDLISKSDIWSSLIPLFNIPDTIFRVLDHYQPDIVHFCEDLIGADTARYRELSDLQRKVKKRFTDVKIMRSIPIPVSGGAGATPAIEIARRFEASSDYFLTDTLLSGGEGISSDQQPVEGFVGITGQACDWTIAAELVKKSSVPVILAGGLSPDNVAEGITRVHPAGVDSCTGTNLVDGNGRPVRFKKDMSKIKRFVEAVRRLEPEMTGASAGASVQEEN
jgi:phosphoribosylanthranilate isomerase